MSSSSPLLTQTLEVAARTDVADGVCSLALRDPSGSALPPWTPGAHLSISLADGLVRQYSLCSDPDDTSSWEVAIRLADPSRGGSARIHNDVREGDRLTVTGPTNTFALEEHERYVFMAGGIGITPILPMLREVARRRADWVLHYGGRSLATMPFHEELRAEHGDRVHVLPEDEHGLLPVADLVGGLSLGTGVYCCGPAPLIDAVEQHCPAEVALHTERFQAREQALSGSAAAPPAEGEIDPDTTPFEVEAAASGVVVTVNPGTTVMDALQEAGVTVYEQCREGLCGTCETFVLAGKPDHRDSILGPKEREASESMFPCVSRSCTPRLVLDA